MKGFIRLRIQPGAGRKIAFAGLMICLLAGFTARGFAEPVTFESLIGEMTDMHALAKYPDPAYKTVQFSSTDRRSNLPQGAGWFANSDGFGSEPIPNVEKVLKEPGDDNIGEYLICDVQGPGAVVRTWTAAIKGDVTMTLDDADKPVFDGSAQDFFQFLCKGYLQQAGIRDLDNAFQQRNACYFPIPFAKRCRVVWRGDVKQLHFYEIETRLYEESAEVKTFSPDDVKRASDAVRAAAKALMNPKDAWTYRSTQPAKPIAATVQSGETQEALKLEGSMAIERLTLKVLAEDVDLALRQTLLHIVFDDFDVPQVLSPIGDFMGAAPGINPFNAVPFTVEPDGTMTCRFVMPFRKNARILIENRGKQPVTVTGSALPCEFNANDENFMHFRAKWRVDHNVFSRPIRDLPFVLTMGRGVYVGTGSYIMNPNMVPTSYGNWWGEGDEKVFVDQNNKPSFLGTGSEDYYNYAWSAEDIWNTPYAGQPRNDGPNTRGFVTNHRWHMLDPIPFESYIAFYMELYAHDETPDMSYARIGYHYARPGAVDDQGPITDEDLRKPELPGDWAPIAKHGSANSVFYSAESIASPDAPHRMDRDRFWADGSVWVWTPSRPGETVNLAVPVTEDGKWQIHLTCGQTPRGGRFAAMLDGDMALDEVSTHRPYRRLLRTSSLDAMELTQGEHTLTLKYLGPAVAGGSGEIAIDFIWVQKR
ncbi:MAG: DUF2961 domain-containing protein [bacterium]|nr:DUF2961 domain-containing protein [bacterium]